MKFFLVKNLDGRLSVAYDSDYEKLKKLKVNEIYEAEIKKPRNLLFHRKFFALIQMVFQNQESYTVFEDLRKDLIIESGYYREYVNIYGELKKVAKSISFASMDDAEFSDLYNAVLDTIIKYFHFDKQDIIENVERYY